MQVRYLIVDDEAPSRTNLRLAMREHAGWVLAGECDSAAAARAALAGQDIEVLFLDIQMPGASGLTLARELSCLPEPPLIVFVTAYSEHALDAFDVHALDYLLKPVSDARLAQALERAGAMLGARQRGAYGAALRDFVDGAARTTVEHLHVRSVGRIDRIAVSEVRWIAAAGNYVELHVEARSLLHRITLNRIETVLPADQFVRVHRSAIVRRDQIVALATNGDGYRLTLRCGTEVAVSERYLAALKSTM